MANDKFAKTAVIFRSDEIKMALRVCECVCVSRAKPLNIFPVLMSVDYFNANVDSVAEERRQLSVEYVA